MRDEYYLLLDEDTLTANKTGEAFRRLWISSTPVIMEVCATGTVSGTTTVKIQESDDNSTWSDVVSVSVPAAGKTRKRLLLPKKYVRATSGASSSSVGHLEVGLIPAGEFTDPA